MSKKDTKNEMPVCSFCGKTRDQVKRLIAGPDGTYICDGCVEICAGIVEEELYNVPEEENKAEAERGDLPPHRGDAGMHSRQGRGPGRCV